MKILAFSDWRTQSINRLLTLLKHSGEDYDLLLYAGDDIHQLIDDGTNRFHELALIADAELGFVRGNDDYPAGVLDLETDLVHDLHRNSIEHQGYLFLGQEGAIGETAMGNIQHSEKQAASHLREQYSNHDSQDVCLVSHNPPYGSLDFAQRFSNKRVGSKEIQKFAEDVEPRFVLCGHVHQFGGQTQQTDHTYVVNAASHDHETAEARLVTIELDDHSTQINHTTVTDRLTQVVDLEQTSNEVFDDIQASTAELRKLTQVGSTRGKLLQKHGFHTISDIVSVDTDRLAEACEMSHTIAERVLNHAKAFETNKPIITDQSRYQKLRDDEPILLDIETDLRQDRIWCVGVYSYAKDAFHQFVELDDEQKLCSTLYEYLAEHEDPTVCYYAGQRFDERILIEVADRHNVPLDSVVAEWIDLCLHARKTVFVPQNGHDLEKIAEELGYEFSQPDITGLEIGSVYSSYLSENEHPEDGWDKYLQYNQDDVFAIKHVIEVGAGELDTGESATPQNEDYSIDGVDIDANPDSVLEVLKGLQKDPEDPVPVDDLVDAAGNLGIGESEVEEAITELKQEEIVSEPEPGYIQISVLEPSQPQSMSTNQTSHSSQIKKRGQAIKPEIPQIPSDDEVRCDTCGSVRNKDEVKTTTIRDKTLHFCLGRCDSSDESDGELQTRVATEETNVVDKVECNECGQTVPKYSATGKYRINDGATVWYCNDC